MIWFIIAVILVVIGISIIIANIHFNDNIDARIGLICIISVIAISPFVYVIGYIDNTAYEDVEAQREIINLHIQYDEKIDVDVIKYIDDYNNRIDRGNNLFCRFDIEDRSKEKIDVNTYIDKFKN